MNKVLQTRLHKGMEVKDRGNCYPAIIASFLNKQSAEEVIQIQELYDENWEVILRDWLRKEGWYLMELQDHLYSDEYYIVSGRSSRGVYHCCIYQNGKIFHDPHPSQEGLLTEESFSILKKIYTLCIESTNTNYQLECLSLVLSFLSTQSSSM